MSRFASGLGGRDRGPNPGAKVERIPIGEVVARYLGPAPGRIGDRSVRSWWTCPFHAEDRNPSFCVDDGDTRYKCFGCGASGDAIDFVRRLEPSLSFREVVDLLGGMGGGPYSTPGERPRREPPRRPEGWQDFARELVQRAEESLRLDHGKEAREYLHARGLDEATIVRSRLGYQPDDERHAGLYGDKSVWIPRGIVIPWFEGETFEAINVRRPVGNPKYVMLRGSQRRIYPGRADIRPGRPLILVEGEFDALLLNQVLEGSAPAVTLGSASDRPDPVALDAMQVASPWYVAGDTDEAGEKSAEGWLARSRRARRVRPPGAFKDWTEAYQAGVGLGRWWGQILAGEEIPPLFTWQEASRIRWGPAFGASDPGFTVGDPSDLDRLCRSILLKQSNP